MLRKCWLGVVKAINFLPENGFLPTTRGIVSHEFRFSLGQQAADAHKNYFSLAAQNISHSSI